METQHDSFLYAADLVAELEHTNAHKKKTYQNSGGQHKTFENQAAAPYWDYQENPNRFEITVNNKEDQQWFILADRYDQAWRAWVNDAEVPVRNWQGMRAVPIAPGENSIVMRYQPWHWRVGLQVTLVSLAAYLLAWVLLHRADRFRAEKSPN